MCDFHYSSRSRWLSCRAQIQIIVDVTCAQGSSGGTDVSVRYTLTGVSDDGVSFVVHFLAEDHYTKMIEEWRVATSEALGLSNAP
jgi:hypothetical protein